MCRADNYCEGRTTKALFGTGDGVNETAKSEAILGTTHNLKAVNRRLPTHTLSELLVPLSGALDLAEGRTAGHSNRVAFIALRLAETLSLPNDTRLACAYAGLFHDV